MDKIEKAIILIAGRGKRLRPLTDKKPKCLIEVKGKPILFNALDCLARNNIKEVVLVVGYLKDEIKKNIGDMWKGMRVKYFDNDIYQKTNNSYSLYLGLKNFIDNLLILEGDVFFDCKLLNLFLKDERENLTIVEKYNPNLDGTFLKVGDNQKVLSWVHKKNRPSGFILEDKYKTVNIHKFSKIFIEDKLFPFLEKHIKETGGIEPIESIFSEIIKNKGEIFAFENKDIAWFEIDDTEDLKKAEEIFK